MASFMLGKLVFMVCGLGRMMFPAMSRIVNGTEMAMYISGHEFQDDISIRCSHDTTVVMDTNSSCDFIPMTDRCSALSGMIDMHVTRVKTVSVSSGKAVYFSVRDAVSIRYADGIATGMRERRHHQHVCLESRFSSISGLMCGEAEFRVSVQPQFLKAVDMMNHWS